ncbi:MAG: mRNA splicing protein, partial [Paramarteilia canceri]
VQNNDIPAIISLRNGKKHIAIIRAFDRHCNLIVTGSQEVTVKDYKYVIDRKILNAFIRGDQIITISYDADIKSNDNKTTEKVDTNNEASEDYTAKRTKPDSDAE